MVSEVLHKKTQRWQLPSLQSFGAFWNLPNSDSDVPSQQPSYSSPLSAVHTWPPTSLCRTPDWRSSWVCGCKLSWQLCRRTLQWAFIFLQLWQEKVKPVMKNAPSPYPSSQSRNTSVSIILSFRHLSSVRRVSIRASRSCLCGGERRWVRWWWRIIVWKIKYGTGKVWYTREDWQTENPAKTNRAYDKRRECAERGE